MNASNPPLSLLEGFILAVLQAGVAYLVISSLPPKLQGKALAGYAIVVVVLLIVAALVVTSLSS